MTEKALNAILKMQPASGGYLEAIPITAFCLLGLKSAGRGDHPVTQNARKFLRATQREDGSWPMTSRSHPGVEKPMTNPVPITYFGSAWGTIGLVRSLLK